MTRRAASDPGFRISRRTVRIGMAVAAAVIALIAIAGLSALARANEPVMIATTAQLKVQQNAAERDVARSYEQALEQVTKVRALNLPISAAQADQIATKAFTDLKTLRHSAFLSLGQLLGMPAGESESYAAATETRFDQAPVTKQSPSPSPVLLVPRFYAIVSRMSEVATLLADQATTQLTASPSAAPSATPSSRPSPSPSPTR